MPLRSNITPLLLAEPPARLSLERISGRNSWVLGATDIAIEINSWQKPTLTSAVLSITARSRDFFVMMVAYFKCIKTN